MKNVLKISFLGILAGLAIGLGSLSFVLLNSIGLKFLGSVAFSIGLILVCFLSLNLYTGKIGFCFANNKKQNLALILIYIGNIIGAVLFGYLCFFIFRNTPIMDTMQKVASTRMVGDVNSGLKAFAMSFMCGALVFLAVYGYRKFKAKWFKLIWIIINVTTFVYFGMEHCIANMIYISMANAWNAQAFINIAITTLGNSLGSIVIYLGVNGIENSAKA